MNPETAIETAFQAWCKREGLRCLKLILNTHRGWPDRAVLIPGGKPLFIEFKAPGGRLSHHQRGWLDELKALGYHVGVARSLEDAIGHVRAASVSARGD